MQSNRIHKVIFWDKDGVMNSQRFYTAWSEGKVERPRHDDYGELFDPESRDLLNKLIEKTGADIVISASCRANGFEWCKEMWKENGMKGEVVGITPHIYTSFGKSIDESAPSIPRGIEIEWYYKTHYNFHHWGYFQQAPFIIKINEECTLYSYVILDDGQDMLFSQKNNFVYCDEMTGFYKEEYEEALKILNTEAEH